MRYVLAKPLFGIVAVVGWCGAVAGQAPAPAVPPATQPGAVKPAEGGAIGKGERLPKSLADLLDTDKDGKVSDVEAGKAAAAVQKKANAKTAEGEAVRKLFDANGDGKIDAKEAAAAVADGRAQIDEKVKKAVEFFDALDTNADGQVEVLEFDAFIGKLGELGKLAKPKLGEIVNLLDKDRNGRLSREEMVSGAEFFAQLEVQKEQRKAAASETQARQIVMSLDRNRDGKIGAREAVGPVAEKFEVVDLNKDKFLSVDEVMVYLEANPLPAARQAPFPRGR